MWSHTGNCGKVNLHIFTANYTMTSFSLPKTVNLTVFYSKTTLKVPLYIYHSYLPYIVRKLSVKPITNQQFFTVAFLQCFTVKITIIFYRWSWGRWRVSKYLRLRSKLIGYWYSRNQSAVQDVIASRLN